MVGWLDGWVVGWLDGWVAGIWMDGVLEGVGFVWWQFEM